MLANFMRSDEYGALLGSKGVHFLGMRNGVPSSILQLKISQFKWRFSNER